MELRGLPEGSPTPTASHSGPALGSPTLWGDSIAGLVSWDACHLLLHGQRTANYSLSTDPITILDEIPKAQSRDPGGASRARVLSVIVMAPG